MSERGKLSGAQADQVVPDQEILPRMIEHSPVKMAQVQEDIVIVNTTQGFQSPRALGNVPPDTE
ncbi:hypothetical protein MASR2M48_11850 [Spirochaetota bacterium]